ncbi:MAG: hypothetical protein GQ564_07220 [Bacteroidales bacterium]|nr:hypothetical protein [Bacteroidales bacterium]
MIKEFKNIIRKGGYLSLIAFVAGVLTLVISTYIFVLDKNGIVSEQRSINRQNLHKVINELGIVENKNKILTEENIKLENQCEYLESRLDSVLSYIDRVEESLPQAKKTDIQYSMVANNLTELDKRINDLKNIDVQTLKDKLNQLEMVIIENPTKALSLPLIKKDIENLMENHDIERLSIRSELNRVYDQNKWFIGLMFTMAIGLLGLATSNFYQSKKENNNSK